MPNGRTGGFYLTPPELEHLLKHYEGNTVVGKMLKEPVTASELMQVLGEWKRDEVPIEEQDHSWYIVHFPEWVAVDAESPLFQGLRQAHGEFLGRWAKEHYKGDGTV